MTEIELGKKQFADDLAREGFHFDASCFKYEMKIGTYLDYSNVVEQMVPCLITDKEGLISFNKLRQNDFSFSCGVGGYLKGPNFILMVHPLFRRGFDPNNSFPHGIIDVLWRENQRYNDISIAIDGNRVKCSESFCLEFDTCYATPFKRNITSIKDGLGHLIQPHDVISIFYPQYSLFIQWHTNGGIKIFQAEEFYNEDVTVFSSGNLYHPARYIHSEFHISDGNVHHLDGAVHLYTHDEYLVRRDSHLGYNKKSTHQIKAISQKLFKINDVLDIDIWSKLVSLYLCGSPLIVEYFTGKYPSNIMRVHQ